MHTILLGGRGGDRTAVRAALESGGFRVVEEAASPGAGSNSGAGCALALLFLDGLDAGDLRELERLRSSRPHTPIVIVAAEASGEAIARALKAGAANVFHTRIEPGELVLRRGTEETHMAVGEGFAEITGDHVTIITDMAIEADSIDEAAVEEARRRAEARLAEKLSAEDAALVQATLARATAQLKVKRARKR